ncbi:MAG: hypothetical protein IJZ53_06725 [Tyzzerella sp.]|nr:hypothetical protein [Tyzzerella sp.]
MKDTIKVKNRNGTLMVAHRGLSGIERENTNAAFIAAANRSYYAIETDVHKTVDGKFVLAHDFNLFRYSGDDIDVEKVTFETMSQMRLKDKDGTKARSDLRISTIEEFLSICKRYGKVAILELKGSFSTEDLEKVCEVVELFDYMEKTIFSSFDVDNLIYIKEKYPEQEVQLAIWKKIRASELEIVEKYKMQLNTKYDIYTKEMIQMFHEKGIKLAAWTVDEPEDAERLMEYGIDYIYTNILE